jgi:hypothetical protein
MEELAVGSWQFWPGCLLLAPLRATGVGGTRRRLREKRSQLPTPNS